MNSMQLHGHRSKIADPAYRSINLLPGHVAFKRNLMLSVLIAFVWSGFISFASSQERKPPELRALVYETSGEWGGTKGVTKLLKDAGFRVGKLTLNRSLKRIKADLIVLGTGATDPEGFPQFCTSFRVRQQVGFALLEFVKNGGILLELAQAKTTWRKGPCFTPEALGVFHTGLSHTDVYVTDHDHPLLKDLPLIEGSNQLVVETNHERPITWDVYRLTPACEALLLAGPQRDSVALLEVKIGSGRALISALTLDKLYNEDEVLTGDPAAETFAAQFFRNLFDYAAEHKAGTLRDPIRLTVDPLPYNTNAWTLVVMPDTQIYSKRFPELFKSQSEWARDHVEDHKIAYVLHEGDVVDASGEIQWRNARNSLSPLRGAVPLAVVPGNHDYNYGDIGIIRQTPLSQYIRGGIVPIPGVHRLCQPSDWYKRGRLENAAYKFSAGGEDWIIMALEYGPRDFVVEWAKEVLDENKDRNGILLTHSYLSNQDERFDLTLGVSQFGSFEGHQFLDMKGSANDGQMLWEKLVSQHEKMRFVFCGHVQGDGLGRLASRGNAGNVVHQILANYQMKKMGGEGFMRLLEFQPDGVTVYVKTYSPYIDFYKTDPDNQFILRMDSLDYNAY